MPPLLCRLGVSHDVVIMWHWPAASLCLICFVCSPCLDQEALPREASALRQTASGYCAVVAGICHCGDFVQRYFHFLRCRGKRREGHQVYQLQLRRQQTNSKSKRTPAWKQYILAAICSSKPLNNPNVTECLAMGNAFGHEVLKLWQQHVLSTVLHLYPLIPVTA